MRHTFPKYERLCGQLRIAALYKDGRKFVVWPLRVTYIQQAASDSTNGQTAPSVLVWAPKSLHKHATDRNRLRRQMREAWRLNKHLLTSNSDSDSATNSPKGGLLIALNYMDKTMQPYAVIEKAVKKAIKRINEEK